MLNRSQAKEVKSMLEASSSPISWNGIQVSEDVDPEIHDPGMVVYSEDSQVVRVPAAEAIFGVPPLSHCLSATQGGLVTVPSKALRAYENAEVVGWRSIKTESGFFSSALQWRLNDTQWLRDSPDEGYACNSTMLARLAPTSSERLFVTGAGLFLGYLEPGNYGAWLFRGLPKLLFAIEAGINFDYLVVPERYAYIGESLGRLGLNVPTYSCREAIGLVFERLHCADDFDAEGVFCPLGLQRLRNFSRTSKNPAKKIYVSRRLNLNSRPRYRPLLNEAEVEELFKENGFRIIYPESLGFCDQIDMFSGAEVIFGPSGSGMLNSQFSPDGARVFDMESFTYTIRQHSRLYGSTGKRYSFVFGEFAGAQTTQPHINPWTIDAALLKEAIDAR